MFRIRPLHIGFYVGCVAALFACAEGTDLDTGEGGAGGDGSWGDTSSSNSSTSSGATGGGGGGTPVTPTTYCDINSADCGSCIACSRDAANGQCVSVYEACINDLNCYDFLVCIGQCPDNDTACLDNCELTYQAGIPLFNDYAGCAICTDCPALCDGPGSGCLP